MHKEVSEILFKHWDIVGVNHIPECRDEYDSYVTDIVALLELDSCTRVHIQKHLSDLREEFFGLPANEKQDSRVADKLMQLLK